MTRVAKLATLLAVVTIQRKQTLLQLDISDEYLKKSSNEYVFVLCKHVKQRRPNYPVPPVVIPRYTADTDICPFLCFEHYIARTETLRHDSVLFISTVYCLLLYCLLLIVLLLLKSEGNL